MREIYKTCAKAPLNRDFGLKGQICRAAVSSISNVAEGLARKSDRDFARFPDVARGPAIETQSLLYVALDIGSIAPREFHRLHKMADETASLTGGFTSCLRRTSRDQTPDTGPKDT